MEEFSIHDFLKKAVAMGASDIHLQVNEYPVIRKDGRIIKIDMPKLTEENIENILNILVPKTIKNKLNNVFDMDFSYEIPGVSRFRINLSRQLGTSALVIRNIPYKVKSLEELNLPVSIEQFAQYNNGLIIVTGPTGCGKSTTLACLIEYINVNYPKHIVTIEDPIEFIFTNKKSIVSQRQVEVDTPSFHEGVKYALRQDPDVILIGEIRDRETIESALKASETGHLVFATLHTNDAIQAITRIVNMFEPKDRQYIRTQIASTLRGTIAQKLLNRENNAGRVPALEILVSTPTVKDFIEKDELEQIYALVKKGSFNEMITMNMSLLKLVQNEMITKDEAIGASENKIELQQMLRGVYHGTSEDSGV